MAIFKDHAVCPCCKGKGDLKLYDAQYPGDPPLRLTCCHCDGKRVVEVEVMVNPGNEDYAYVYDGL